MSELREAHSHVARSYKSTGERFIKQDDIVLTLGLPEFLFLVCPPIPDFFLAFPKLKQGIFKLNLL